MDTSTINILIEYGGNCTLILYFVLCVIYLFVREKNKVVKVMLSVFSIVVLVLFAMPIAYDVLAVKLGETSGYYRLLWMLPTSIVSAYATLKFATELPRKYMSYVFIGIMVVCFAIGGNLVYKSPFFVKAENIYQVPDVVVHLCDYIEQPDEVVKATFPMELCPYVRLYDTNVVQTYGYETLREGMEWAEPYIREMINGNPNTEILADGARYNHSQYVILNSTTELNGTMEEFNYVLVETIDGYDVYMDALCPLYKELYEVD